MAEEHQILYKFMVMKLEKKILLKYMILFPIILYQKLE